MISITISGNSDEVTSELRALLAMAERAPGTVAAGIAGSTARAIIEQTGAAPDAGGKDIDPKSPPDKAPSGRTRNKNKDDAPKGNISTSPEDRKDPAVSEADQAKDKADEQAESAGNKTAGTLKHDDIRGALGDYVKAFGMPAALEDGPKVLAMVLGDKPDKTDWKISEIPEDQDKLGKILGGIKEMTEKNPFKREAAKAA